MAIRLGFDAFDVRQEDLLLVKSDLGAVRWIACRDLLQVVAEDLGPQSCRYIALCEFGSRIVHDGNRTV